MTASALPIPQQLANEPTIQPLLAKARRDLQTLELAKLEMEDMCFPESAVERLTKEIHHAPSGSDISRLQAEIAKFTGPAAQAVKARAVNLLVQQYPTEALLALGMETKARLQAYRAAASEAERAFFASHGLPHESTSCSRRFEPLIAQLNGYIEHLKNPPATIGQQVPAHTHALVTWLGAQAE